MGIFDKITGRVTDIFDEVMIPEDVHRAHESALRMMQADRYAEALSTLKTTASTKSNIARTHYLLGQCYVGLGELDRAADAYEVAAGMRPQALTHVRLAAVYEDLERFREAEHHFQAALDTEEKGDWRANAHFGLGRVFLALERPGKAAKELQLAAVSVDSDLLRLLLAKALYLRGQHAKALDALDGLGELSNTDAQVSDLLRATILEAQGHMSEARGLYETLSDDDATTVDALMGAARLNLRASLPAKAESYAQRAMADSNTRAAALLLQGQAFLELNRIADAKQAFMDSLALEPNPVAQLGLGRAALQSDDATAAIPHLEAAMKGTMAEAGLAAAGLELGRARRHGGDLAGARLVLLEATTREADLATAAWCRAELAEIALEQNDPAHAIVIVQETFNAPKAPAKRLEEIRQGALELLRPQWDVPEQLDDPLALSDVLDQVLQHAANDVRLTTFVPDIQRISSQLEAPLSLAIVGEFNAGKSTIVNALIGESVLPTGVLPTTAHSGILKYGPRKAARVFDMDGSVQEVSVDEARVLMKTNAEEIEHLEFVYPHPALRVVEYWDTPGFNAINPRHEEIARKALSTAEAILWVMDANQVLSQTEFDLIDCVPDAVERLLVVINKIDRLGPLPDREEAVGELLEYVQENLDGHIVGAFAMSALNFWEGDEKAKTESGFEAFESFLDARILQRAGRIKVVEGRRSFEALVVAMQAFQEGLIAQTRTHMEAIERLRTWLHDEAVASAKRASVFVRELDDQVDFMLKGIELEISEALRPSGSMLNSKRVLTPEDRTFLLELIEERLASVLTHAFSQQEDQLSQLESAIAAGLDPILRGVSLTDARALQGRMDGFFDESLTLQRMLDASVYGEVRAETRGRVAASGDFVLNSIVVAQAHPNQWRTSLRTLVPRLSIESHLADWYIEYFENAYRLLLRARADLERTMLEAQYRYDFGALSLVVLQDAQD